MNILRELIVDKNENEQRIDRFLKKYLEEANPSFIYKMLRKKNIKLNGKKAKPEDMIYEGDKIELFLSEETIEKFIRKQDVVRSKLIPDIIYEDDNIILINKNVDVLSHGSGGDYEENIVDSMISYLIQKGDYVPRIEKTFTPSICNRLDRNTSGIIVGAKNYEALKEINKAFKKSTVRRFYKTIVSGTIEKEIRVQAYLGKDEDRNLVKVYRRDGEGLKKIETHINPLASKDGYSLIEIELKTGRTHQIRAHLSFLGYPIIGDRKYGKREINNIFNERYELEDQWLHGYKIEFHGLEGPMEYLNGKVFTSQAQKNHRDMERDLF